MVKGLSVRLIGVGSPAGLIVSALDADPTRLAQVISNLLNNAAKYSDPRGRIWLTAEREGNCVAVHVRDRGIGISSEILPRVFDLFVQAEGGRDRTHGGLGIGLTLVRRLVELHGGTVEATSAGVGHGSQFTLCLPLAAGAAPLAGATDSEGAPPADRAPAGAEVLIVDDNVDAAMTLERLLASRGYCAHAVFDGAAAIKWVEAHRPAAVLLDIGMPEMDGYEVARRLRCFAGPNELLLIALTGWGQEDDRRRSNEAGFQAHLVKPVKLSEIEELLAQRSTVAAG